VVTELLSPAYNAYGQNNNTFGRFGILVNLILDSPHWNQFRDILEKSMCIPTSELDQGDYKAQKEFISITLLSIFNDIKNNAQFFLECLRFYSPFFIKELGSEGIKFLICLLTCGSVDGEAGAMFLEQLLCAIFDGAKYLFNIVSDFKNNAFRAEIAIRENFDDTALSDLPNEASEEDKERAEKDKKKMDDLINQNNSLFGSFMKDNVFMRLFRGEFNFTSIFSFSFRSIKRILLTTTLGIGGTIFLGFINTYGWRYIVYMVPRRILPVRLFQVLRNEPQNFRDLLPQVYKFGFDLSKVLSTKLRIFFK